jgi:hypothetical protein
MADAIPVHSKPKVKAAPAVDANGVAIPEDYIATPKEGLGTAADFNPAREPKRRWTLPNGTVCEDW